MKHSSFLIRVFVAASVLGMVDVALVTEAHAEENASLPYREASKPPISVETLESYTLVKLNRVYFNYEASDLSPKEKIALNEIVRRLSSATPSVIELRGYTDGMESARRGTVLASKRSQAIADYLNANGVSSDSILLIALDGMSDKDRSMNPEHRRVDIRVFTPGDSGEGETHAALHGRRQLVGSTGTNRVR